MGRLATAGLLATLGALHPRWHFGFLALLMLDVFSHWFQMYAALMSGSATHKARRRFPCLGLFALVAQSEDLAWGHPDVSLRVLFVSMRAP